MRRQLGFSYVIVMFVVAMLTLSALRGLQVTVTNERRDKEAQLLTVGLAYREAIRAYYENGPGGGRAYPPDLNALLDAPGTTLHRYLRKRFRDPISGSDMALITAPDGGVMGVYSPSTRTPIKSGNFPPELAEFVHAKNYQEWRFVYLANSNQTPINQGP